MRALAGAVLSGTLHAEEPKENMRPYEIMVIFDQDQAEDDVKKSTKSYCDQIQKAGATLGTVDHWGKRKFAYPINKKPEGYYVVLQTKSEPEVVAELDRQLGLDTGVVRHKVLRIPETAYIQ